MRTSEPQSSSRIGPFLDAWIPRLLKILGLVGFGLSLVMATLGHFEPALFGGSLMAASGGYVGDALNAIKPGRE